MGFRLTTLCISQAFTRKDREQAGAELGQAQLKLGLDFNSFNLN